VDRAEAEQRIDAILVRLDRGEWVAVGVGLFSSAAFLPSCLSQLTVEALDEPARHRG
jgi:hypothetical protein